MCRSTFGLKALSALAQRWFWRRDATGLCLGVQLVRDLCLRMGRAGEEGTAKGWTQSLLSPHQDAGVVSLGDFQQEKRTRTEQLPSPIFLDPSAGYEL